MSGNDLDKITLQEESRKDTQIAKIENDLASEKDARKEERFIWAFVCIMTLNVTALPLLGWHSILFVAMELIFLILFGRLCGQNDVLVVTQKVFESMKNIKFGG